MSWTEAVDKFIEQFLSRGNSPASATLMRISLRYLMDFSGQQGRQTPADVTDSDIVAYQQSLRWQPGYSGRLPSEQGVARNLETVRSFFRWAAEHRLLLIDPTRNLVVRRVQSLSRPVLTVEEVQHLLGVPQLDTVLGIRDRAVLETLYGTGLRRSEFHALDLEHLDLRTGTLTVLRGKGGNGRVVPLGDNLVAVLQQYLAASRPKLNPRLGERALFLSRDGLRLAYAQIAKLVRVVAERAGLRRVVAPHDLRHALATHLLAAGADLRMVQSILGHTSVMSTQRYTHLADSQVADAFRDAHPRARRLTEDPDALDDPDPL